MAAAPENAATSWRIRGSYFESCNCDPICPCRRIDGARGGRSTHGVCMGVLSWVIDEGDAAASTSRLPVAIAIALQRRRAGLAMELDPVPRRARDDEQRDALERIFTRPARRRSDSAFPVGMEAERAPGSPSGRDRGRPHAPPAVAASPRPRQRPNTRPAPDRPGRHVRHPRPRSRRARSSSRTSCAWTTTCCRSTTAASAATRSTSTTGVSGGGGASAGSHRRQSSSSRRDESGRGPREYRPEACSDGSSSWWWSRSSSCCGCARPSTSSAAETSRKALSPGWAIIMLIVPFIGLLVYTMLRPSDAQIGAARRSSPVARRPQERGRARRASSSSTRARSTPRAASST